MVPKLYLLTQAERISGYTHDELITMDPFNIIHPDNRSKIWERMQARMNHQEIEADEHILRLINKSGDILLLQYRSVLVEWEGKPALLV